MTQSPNESSHPFGVDVPAVLFGLLLLLPCGVAMSFASSLPEIRSIEAEIEQLKSGQIDFQLAYFRTVVARIEARSTRYSTMLQQHSIQLAANCRISLHGQFMRYMDLATAYRFRTEYLRKLTW